MVTEGRRWQIDVVLNFSCRGAFFAALHDEAKDRETRRVAEGAQLLRVEIEFAGHPVFLLFSK
jgi:hypothetical protein